ncbi:bifunctional folylpolyglutamate synthase/dihydrofolate synthase [Rickettsiales bacterium]|nr:bifunctional folylpolyglutamate synthase/dihydrofolate synthase [Rickettsiales bacterium]
MAKYDKVLKRLEILHPKQIDLSLGRILKLLGKLGNPHLKLPPTIHVAGTNGKGSTIAFLRSIYENNGYKVHTYTSPHLINFNERIRINSKIIDNQSLVELLEECEFYNKNNPITFFEITTAAAYLCFSREKADILLLETGLGGRFDATNVISDKICSVLTPISMDHMSFLGKSIKSITKEKVGIFQRNRPAFISPQSKEALEIIDKEASKKKVELFKYESTWKITKRSKDKFTMKIYNENFNVPKPKLFGVHQIYNAGLAITVSKILKDFSLNNKKIYEGVQDTFWPARMQKIDVGKLKEIAGNSFELWLDGGHNSHASEMLLKNLYKWKKENLFLIFGMISGKEPEEFLKKILPLIKFLQVIPIKKHQFINSKELQKIFKKESNIIRPEKTIQNAINYITNHFISGKIIICGSLYLAGDVLKSNGSLIT